MRGSKPEVPKMCQPNNPSPDCSRKCLDQVSRDKAAVIAAVERQPTAWTETFASMLQSGYLKGRILDNPDTLSPAELEECELPAVYIQLDCFVRGNAGHREFDYKELGCTTACAVRMADNLVHTFRCINHRAGLHRRIAIEARGMSRALAELGYGPSDKRAWRTASQITNALKLAAYRMSVALAAEKGPYPAFDRYTVSGTPHIRLLPKELRLDIAHFGLRNASIFREPLLAMRE